MPQGATPFGAEMPASGLHAGDVIRAARDSRHKSVPVTISQIVKGSTGPSGHNFVAAKCQPRRGAAFTINVPSEQLITVLSREARGLEPTGYLGRNIA